MRIVDAKKADPNFVPLCPHCAEELETIYRVSDRPEGFFEGHDGFAYACPHCRKILGFADWGYPNLK